MPYYTPFENQSSVNLGLDPAQHVAQEIATHNLQQAAYDTSAALQGASSDQAFQFTQRVNNDIQAYTNPGQNNYYSQSDNYYQSSQNGQYTSYLEISPIFQPNGQQTEAVFMTNGRSSQEIMPILSNYDYQSPNLTPYNPGMSEAPPPCYYPNTPNTYGFNPQQPGFYGLDNQADEQQNQDQLMGVFYRPRIYSGPPYGGYGGYSPYGYGPRYGLLGLAGYMAGTIVGDALDIVL